MHNNIGSYLMNKLGDKGNQMLSLAPHKAKRRLNTQHLPGHPTPGRHSQVGEEGKVFIPPSGSHIPLTRNSQTSAVTMS